MLRSMYAGISGMKNFQTKLDVIGNNIANVNTSGFKKSTVTFQEMMSQTTSPAQGATETKGGVNASQVGLGSQLGSISNIQTEGFRQTTNNPLDFSIEGDGMFVVASNLVYQDEESPDGLGSLVESSVELGESSLSYTRSGNFYLDDGGNIVNSQGLYLIGNKADIDGDAIVLGNNGELYSVDRDGNLYEVQYVDYEGNVLEVEADDAGNLSVGDDEIDSTQIILSKVDDTPDTPDGDDFEYDYLFSPINIPSNAQSFSVQTNGTVNYIASNGSTQVAGRVGIASFSNTAGLQKVGNNLFLNSENAGYNGIFPGEINSTGSIVSGSVEMSNVDLAEEFTEMITAQRGFQANTRIITTSDEILQELVNLKR
ncbi:flagellar hook-basal body complex protein [Oceanobacillus halophilus]|uniref:Flagellar hook protein FlgE n=1 Tax=Oceanobacillus halophilus TaxID=930130 RepID=A0A495AD01_9BACI|nr:flagellar hook-basal body complex protein [Oceanobacillus halophilus]RKQ37490.1 flagellar hook-basal body complex protein [Oceanobacillus halophilus]